MEQTGINPKKIKFFNDTALLYLLCSEGALSRKQIASKLGLTAAAVSKISKRLIDSGKIKEMGISAENSDRAGRKEVLLALKSDDKISFGITLELDCITFSLCDISGKLIKIEKQPFISDNEKIVAAAKIFLSECPLAGKTLLGIGLCVIGSVENDVFGVLDNEGLIACLEKELGMPVAAENNVKAYALSELLYGSVPSDSSVLFFKWGMGIGSAVAAGGKVLSGSDSSLTEIGHYIVDSSGVKCRCGRYGCLETVASAAAMSAEAGGMSLEQIVNSEDEHIIHMLDEKIDMVALALTNTATILNAKSIVLFGSVFDNQKIEEKLVRQCCRYNSNLTAEMIGLSELSSKSSYIGAAALGARFFFFEKE